MELLIATIILIISLLGILIILFRKTSILTKLPEIQGTLYQGEEENLTSKLKEKIENNFSQEKILQKILSWFRILVLKVERKIDKLLQSLRKKSKEKQKKKKEKQNWGNFNNKLF